ncbi:coiled-coil domain-containing protein 1-like [Cynara cardunculus var. scolymus]|uniref:coiled-coil domain-containing protein 1-like n=1 Tax=Cynara cardunculus var. scolymus TaxID=59895 RepID=UPI000D628351|nr:coiled-coil domain-containing protein 1-like [Cynara cardunculus var. scolymus]
MTLVVEKNDVPTFVDLPPVARDKTRGKHPSTDGPSGTKPTSIETDVYDMTEDMKLLMLVVATVLDKMDEVHKAMPSKEEVTSDLCAVKAKKEALSNIKHRIEDLSSSLNDLSSRLDNDKEGEKDEGKKIVAMETAEAASKDLALIPHTYVILAAEDAINANANANAEAEDDDDAMIAPAIHEDHPSTFTLPNVGDEDDDEDDEDEDKEPHISDARKDLGDNNDDEDDDDDDFNIQFHQRQPVLKGVFFRELASQGERPSVSGNQHSSSKDKGKGVAKDGNLAIILKTIDPSKVAQSSRFIPFSS